MLGGMINEFSPYFLSSITSTFPKTASRTRIFLRIFISNDFI